MVQFILLWNLSKRIVRTPLFCAWARKVIQFHPSQDVQSSQIDLHARQDNRARNVCKALFMCT